MRPERALPLKEKSSPETKRSNEKGSRLSRRPTRMESPFRPQQTEERRSEQYAGQHFRYHLRLAKPRSDASHKPAEKKNDGKLKKKVNGESQVVHGACKTTYSS